MQHLASFMGNLNLPIMSFENVFTVESPTNISNHQSCQLHAYFWGFTVRSCLQIYFCYATNMGFCESLPLPTFYFEVASSYVTIIHFNFFSKFHAQTIRVLYPNEINSRISKANVTSFVSLFLWPLFASSWIFQASALRRYYYW